MMRREAETRWEAKEKEQESRLPADHSEKAIDPPEGGTLFKKKKYIVFGCHHGAYACGGHGDRWNGIFVAFLLAVVTGRDFLIDMPDPIALDNFLVPARDPFTGERNVDWVVDDELRVQLGLPGKRAFLLWDYNEFREKYFRQFLHSADEVILIYTNKKSFFGQIYRYLFYERQAQTDWVRMPYLAHYVFEYLFQPSVHMLKRLVAFDTNTSTTLTTTAGHGTSNMDNNDEPRASKNTSFGSSEFVSKLEETQISGRLSIDPAAMQSIWNTDELNARVVALAAENHYLNPPREDKSNVDPDSTRPPLLRHQPVNVFTEHFIGIHYRSGDIKAGFGQVNEDIDVRHGVDMLVRMLSCASEVERVLELDSARTRWYLASDNAEVFAEVPQVTSWIESGKIFHVGNTRTRTHLSQLQATSQTLNISGASQQAHGLDSKIYQNEQEMNQAEAYISSPRFRKLDQIRGVSDGWTDFLVLSKAVAVIASSSAFGLVASQVGAVPYVFSSDSCIRIDLH
ncbi:unnamed protein product [Amoebophrya sp. A25]|nr:unnamed protein product [Amoebophrya sp. A25]|eukprot:GSA25T00016174001.1